MPLGLARQIAGGWYAAPTCEDFRTAIRGRSMWRLGSQLAWCWTAASYGRPKFCWAECGLAMPNFVTWSLCNRRCSLRLTHDGISTVWVGNHGWSIGRKHKKAIEGLWEKEARKFGWRQCGGVRCFGVRYFGCACLERVQGGSADFTTRERQPAFHSAFTPHLAHPRW